MGEENVGGREGAVGSPSSGDRDGEGRGRRRGSDIEGGR